MYIAKKLNKFQIRYMQDLLQTHQSKNAIINNIKCENNAIKMKSICALSV